MRIACHLIVDHLNPAGLREAQRVLWDAYAFHVSDAIEPAEQVLLTLPKIRAKIEPMQQREVFPIVGDD